MIDFSALFDSYHYKFQKIIIFWHLAFFDGLETGNSERGVTFNKRPPDGNCGRCGYLV